MRVGVFVLALCGVAHGFQAAPAKGSIEGQVMNLKAGSPLKKATVQLVMMNAGGGGGGRGPMPPPVRRVAETDEQGRFAFANLDPGKFQLSAERQGFLRQNYGARKYSGGGTPVLVAEGQNVKSIVFQLVPQAVITGKVLDEDGEGMAGEPVRALRYVYRGGKRQWTTVGTAQTSDIGEFRLPNLEPGPIPRLGQPAQRRHESPPAADRRTAARHTRHDVRRHLPSQRHERILGDSDRCGRRR